MGKNRASTDLVKLQILDFRYKLLKIGYTYLIYIYEVASKLNCVFESCSAKEEILSLFSNAFC